MPRFLLLGPILFGLFMTSCSGGATAVATDAPVPAEYAGMTNPLGPAAAGDGAQVFKNNCASCHGPEGRGDGPAGAALDPRPKDLAGLQAVAGDDFLFWRVSEGVPGTSMIGWGGILTEEEIWQLVAFIRTLE